MFHRGDQCLTNHLSILLEEEVSGGHSPARTSLQDSTDSLASNKAPSTIPTESERSVAALNLSASDGKSGGSPHSSRLNKDSGHSSTIESLSDKESSDDYVRPSQ